MVSSIEVGLGGVWVLALPNVVFIPDRNGDDVPDGPSVVHVEGFKPPQENHHNIANGLRFGPDGWLYGRCGASGPADVNVAGRSEKIPVRGGMWRYHPQRRVVEAITCGNTNPWGHDWNEHGELFYVNTVNGHLWHAVSGEHFKRAHTIDPNPHSYELIEHHADHWHFDTSGDWTKSRDGAANAFGGGHSHIGAMVYLGDNWPAEYRGKLFTLNQHGRRANMEILERSGSGYVGKHGKDFFIAGDAWFRGLDLSYGPDGGVFVLDWSDTGECHDNTGVHRSSGRIFKITHGTPKRVDPFDLSKLTSRELVNYHTHANEWFVRQARLELMRRAAEGRGLDAVKQQLPVMIKDHADPVVKLRALWTLYAIGAADEALLLSLLKHDNEHLRTWAVRLLVDQWPTDLLTGERPKQEGAAPLPSERLSREFIQLGQKDSSGLVRLALASALQRFDPMVRVGIVTPLLERSEDAKDHNLPLLVWYGLIPVANADPNALAAAGVKCELPQTRRFIARRLAQDIEKNPSPINQMIQMASTKPTQFQIDLLDGLSEAFTGWRKAPKPAAWDSFVAFAAKAPAEVRDRVRELSVVFGDGRALDDVKRLALDSSADLAARKAALQTLVDNRPPDLRQICEKLLSVRFLNPIAARGLAQFDDPAVAAQMVKAYRQFHQSERGQLLAVLVSRPAFARVLLEAVAKGTIPRADVSAFHARQIRGFNDPDLTALLTKAWGELRDGAEAQQKLIAQLRGELTPAVLAKADKGNGRTLFNLACASCHRLYGQGGEVGPDLTGAGRDNLDYLLDNIVNPGGVVSADYRMSVVELKDGRVLNAVITARTDRTLTLQTMTEKLTVERGDVAKLEESTLSLMPEGLLESLTPEQRRDLLAYLMHPTQVALPGGQ
jgi:putative membrane-bound dehydrogenase-like protein